jgi:hypothetical protein
MTPDECGCGWRTDMSIDEHRATLRHSRWAIEQEFGYLVRCMCGGTYRIRLKDDHERAEKHARYIRRVQREADQMTPRQQWANGRVECECGGHYTRANRNKHEQSARHKKYEAQPVPPSPAAPAALNE